MQVFRFSGFPKTSNRSSVSWPVVALGWVWGLCRRPSVRDGVSGRVRPSCPARRHYSRHRPNRPSHSAPCRRARIRHCMYWPQAGGPIGAMGATARIRPGRRVAVGACMRIISEARVVAPCKGTGRACAARNVACRQAVLLKPSGISDQAGPSALQPGTHPQFFAGAPGVRCRRALLPPGHPRAGGRHRAPAA